MPCDDGRRLGTLSQLTDLLQSRVEDLRWTYKDFERLMVSLDMAYKAVSRVCWSFSMGLAPCCECSYTTPL